MNLLPGVLLAVTSTVAMHLPLAVHKEELPPLAPTMCDEVLTELLIAVHEGYIDPEVAEEVGARCYFRYGGVNTNK